MCHILFILFRIRLGPILCGNRSLMDAHGVSKRAREEIIIALGDCGEDGSKGGFLGRVEVCKGGDVALIWEDCEAINFEHQFRRSMIVASLRMISKGQVAHHGTNATQSSFFTTTLPSSCATPTSKCAYSHNMHGRPFGPRGASEGGISELREYLVREVSSREGM